MRNHISQFSISIALFCLALLGCSDEVQQNSPTKEVVPTATVEEKSPEIKNDSTAQNTHTLMVAGITLEVNIKGSIAPNAMLDVSLVETSGGRASAIRLWIGDETGVGSVKIRVHSHGSSSHAHVQSPATLLADSALWIEDIDAAADMLVIGATKVLGCSGGLAYGAHVYVRGKESWDYVTRLLDGDSNGKWVACDSDTVVSWCSISGPNSTFDYLETWRRTGNSFTNDGSLSSASWGYDIYFPESMQIADGILSFGTCDSYWGCQTNTTTNRTVYTAQKNGNYWRLGNPVTIPSGYGSTGFGRNTKMGGGSLLIGAPAYSSSRGVVFQTSLAQTLPCPADLNNDGSVNVSDVLRIISQWGGSGREDLNGDSIVNVSDLLYLLNAWGNCY